MHSMQFIKKNKNIWVLLYISCSYVTLTECWFLQILAFIDNLWLQFVKEFSSNMNITDIFIYVNEEYEREAKRQLL